MERTVANKPSSWSPTASGKMSENHFAPPQLSVGLEEQNKSLALTEMPTIDPKVAQRMTEGIERSLLNSPETLSESVEQETALETGEIGLVQRFYQANQAPKTAQVHPIQAQISIEEPKEQYEQEEDRATNQVVQRLHVPRSSQGVTYPQSSHEFVQLFRAKAQQERTENRTINDSLFRRFGVANSAGKETPQSGSGEIKEGIVQRMCDSCASELSQEQKKEEIQTKLTIGQPGDKYEQEADRIAATVMSMAEPIRNQSIEEEVQTKTMIQRQENSSLPPVPNYQLTPPSLLQPPDPASRYRLGEDLHLHLDPQIQAMITQQLNPASIRSALGQINLTLPTSGINSPTASNPFAAPTIPAAASPVPAGAGPDTPRPATGGDLMQAILAVPAIDAAVTSLQTQVSDRITRDWHRLRTGEQIGVVSTAVVIGGGALVGILSDPTSRQFVLNQLNGRTFPVPGLNWLNLEINTGDNNLMLGLHIDVGRLLPASLGFGSSSPSAIGSPPQPEPSPVQRSIQRMNSNSDLELEKNLQTSSNLEQQKVRTSQRQTTSLLQRWPWSDDRTDRQRIDDAIRNRSVSDAKAINDVNVAREAERITLIDILSHQGWVGPRDESQIERLWNSFGRNLAQVMEANAALWEHCIAVGAELEDIQAVQNLRNEFRRDVQITAVGYLAGNRTVVNQEMRQFGIAEEEGGTDTPITETQEQRLREMQQAARIVAQLQRGQEDLRQIRVGYSVRRPVFDGDPGGIMPESFDPVQQPEIPPDASDQNMRPWATVKAEYDRASAIIASLTDRFPALYAISREGQSGQTQQFADSSSPAAARAQLAPALRRLNNHIHDAQTKLRDGDINPLDLLPIHEQLFAGRAAASGTNWSHRLPHWAADQERASHTTEQFWTQLGLNSLSAAAFMLAPFTGGASLLVQLVGLGAAGAQAMMSTERYQALAAAARTEVRSGTALVTTEQVSVAQIQMEADQVAFAIAALLVAVGIAASGVRALRGRAVSGLPEATVSPDTGSAFGRQMVQQMRSAGFRGNPFREFMQRLNARPQRLQPQEAAEAIEVATREYSGGTMGTMPPLQQGNVLVVVGVVDEH